MKRNGPPFGSGPGAEWKTAVGGLPFIRSAEGRASPQSSSASALAPASSAAPTCGVIITVVSVGESQFEAWCDGQLIVARTRQPLLDGARALLTAGYHPDTVAVMRHAGSDVDALTAQIGIAARFYVEESAHGPILRAVRKASPAAVDRAPIARTREAPPRRPHHLPRASRTPPVASTETAKTRTPIAPGFCNDFTTTRRARPAVWPTERLVNNRAGGLGVSPRSVVVECRRHNERPTSRRGSPELKTPGNAVPIATRTLRADDNNTPTARRATPGSVKATQAHGMALVLGRARKNARRRWSKAAGLKGKPSRERVPSIRRRHRRSPHAGACGIRIRVGALGHLWSSSSREKGRSYA